MKGARPLHHTGAATILTRLLLAFALLFVDLFADMATARSEPTPSGASHLMTGPGLAIVPPDATRVMAGLPQDDSADAVSPPMAQPTPLYAKASTPQHSLTPIYHPAKAHLRPFPHGPPLV